MPRVIGSVGALAVTLAVSPVRAQESDGERLFREGRARMLEGRFAEACPKLEESQRIEPRLGTLLNLAACHEREGKIATAWAEYRAALTTARTDGQTDRTRFAEQRLAVLEPRVPWVRVAAPARTTVRLDGAELDPIALGKDMPVDPGHHVVTAHVDGARVYEERFSLGESERKTIVIDVDVLAQRRGAAAEPPEATTKPPTVQEDERERRRFSIDASLLTGFFYGRLLAPSPAGAAATACEREGGCIFPPTPTSTSVTAGVAVHAGYAVTERLDVGGRLLAAATIARRGLMLAVGPSVSLRLNRSLRVGLWGALGDASFRTEDNVNVAGSTVLAELEGSLGGALGAGAELSLLIGEALGGEIDVSAYPFFLEGPDGSAAALPVGATYRFR